MKPRSRSSVIVSVVALAGVAAAVAMASAASAHEHVRAGDLEFTVGWGSEPPVVYQMNSITVRVERILQASGTEPVAGVAANMTVTISTGTVSGVKAVEEQFGNPGTYEFAVVPTRVGTYTVRIEGQINGTDFDVNVEPEHVVAGLDVNFPVTDPTPKELADNASAQQAKIEALEGQVAELLATGGGTVTQGQLDEARAAASLATWVAATGLVVGAAGAAVAATAWRTRNRPPGTE